MNPIISTAITIEVSVWFTGGKLPLIRFGNSAALLDSKEDECRMLNHIHIEHISHLVVFKITEEVPAFVCVWSVLYDAGNIICIFNKSVSIYGR